MAKHTLFFVNNQEAQPLKYVMAFNGSRRVDQLSVTIMGRRLVKYGADVRLIRCQADINQLYGFYPLTHSGEDLLLKSKDQSSGHSFDNEDCLTLAAGDILRWDDATMDFTKPWRILLRVKFTGSNVTLFHNTAGSGTAWTVSYSGGALRFVQGRVELAVNGAINDGAWHTISFGQRDATETYIEIDGVYTTRADIAYIGNNTGSEIQLGSSTFAGDVCGLVFAGNIPDAHVEYLHNSGILDLVQFGGKIYKTDYKLPTTDIICYSYGHILTSRQIPQVAFERQPVDVIAGSIAQYCGLGFQYVGGGGEIPVYDFISEGVAIEMLQELAEITHMEFAISALGDLLWLEGRRTDNYITFVHGQGCQVLVDHLDDQHLLTDIVGQYKDRGAIVTEEHQVSNVRYSVWNPGTRIPGIRTWQATVDDTLPNVVRVLGVRLRQRRIRLSVSRYATSISASVTLQPWEDWTGDIGTVNADGVFTMSAALRSRVVSLTIGGNLISGSPGNSRVIAEVIAEIRYAKRSVGDVEVSSRIQVPYPIEQDSRITRAGVISEDAAKRNLQRVSANRAVLERGVKVITYAPYATYRDGDVCVVKNPIKNNFSMVGQIKDIKYHWPSLKIEINVGEYDYTAFDDRSRTIRKLHDVDQTPFANEPKVDILGALSIIHLSSRVNIIDVTPAPPDPTDTAPHQPVVTLAWSAGTITASWNAPNDGGDAIIKYQLRWRRQGQSWTDVDNIATRTYDITGLAMDVTYEVQVRAVNRVGAGSWSNVVSHLEPTPTILAAPSNLVLTTAGTVMEATWDAVSGAAAYKLRYRTGSGSWTERNASGTVYNIEGLTVGTTYEVQVATVGSDGVTGAYSGAVTKTAATLVLRRPYQTAVHFYPDVVYAGDEIDRLRIAPCIVFQFGSPPRASFIGCNPGTASNRIDDAYYAVESRIPLPSGVTTVQQARDSGFTLCAEWSVVPTNSGILGVYRRGRVDGSSGSCMPVSVIDVNGGGIDENIDCLVYRNRTLKEIVAYDTS